MKEHKNCLLLGHQELLQLHHKENNGISTSNVSKSTSPAAQTKIAQDFATAIDTFVKTATVTTTVTGTASGGVCTPAGPVVGAVVSGTGIGAPGAGLS